MKTVQSPLPPRKKSFYRPRAPCAPLRTAGKDYRRPPGANARSFGSLVDRHKSESPLRRGKVAAVSAKSPTLGSTRVDCAPSTRPAVFSGGIPGGHVLVERGVCRAPCRGRPPYQERGPCPLVGRANAPAICVRPKEAAGCSAPVLRSPSTVSPTSRSEAPSSSGKTNPRERPPWGYARQRRAGGTGGPFVGDRRKCRRSDARARGARNPTAASLPLPAHARGCRDNVHKR